MTDAVLSAHETNPPAPAARRSRVSAAPLASVPLLFVGLGLALLAQRFLAERVLPLDGVVLYGLALLAWHKALEVARPVWDEPLFWRPSATVGGTGLARPRQLAAAAGFALLSWILLSPESFTRGGVIAWLFSHGFFVHAVIGLKDPRQSALWRRALALPTRGLRLSISTPALVLGAILLLGAFVRFYQLPHVPAEVTSDQVEKLLDVRDVLQGKTPIFFPRNTGREPLEFYLAAPVAAIVGLKHLALQIVTIGASLGAIAATYLLGKEVLSTRYGLLAAFMMAVSRWDITLARIGLRFSLSVLFTALTLFFLFRAMRTQQSSYYLAAGVSMGLGLLGYSNFRVVPLLVGLVWLIGMLLRQRAAPGDWRAGSRGLGVLAGAAVLVALPLARFVAAHPDQFWSRAVSRVASTERGLPGDPVALFLDNLANALLMFNWRGDIGWVHNVQQLPALDQVTAALFAIGIGYLGYRLLRLREAWVAALLISIPVLLLPSALSIAFPIENPSFNRAGAAIPVVYVVAALAPGMAWGMLNRMLPDGTGAGLGNTMLVVLLLSATAQNLGVYFGEYAQNFRRTVPNSSEIAAVAEGYARAIGGRENVYIFSYPHWVDHRAIGMHMGDITWDNVLLRPEEAARRAAQAPKVFLIHPQDLSAQQTVRQLHPGGESLRYESSTEGKDFLVYLALPG